MASVGLSLSREASHCCTVGSRRNVGREEGSVVVRSERSAAARALFVWENEVAGRGARHWGKREASDTKMEVGVGKEVVGIREARMAWSVSRPVGEAMDKRSARWIRQLDERGDPGRGGRAKEAFGGRSRRRSCRRDRPGVGAPGRRAQVRAWRGVGGGGGGGAVGGGGWTGSGEEVVEGVRLGMYWGGWVVGLTRGYCVNARNV